MNTPIHALALAALLVIPSIALSQKGDAAKATGGKVAELLNTKGGEDAAYELNRSTDADAAQKITRLKTPVDASVLTKAFGKPDSIEQDKYCWIGSRPGNAVLEPKGDIWRYGHIGVFVRDDKAHEYAEFPKGNKPEQKPSAQPAGAELPLPAKWSKYSDELSGRLEVRVKNPNPFSVRVGLRTAGKGKDFVVPADGKKSATVPPGRYEIYFQYSTDPKGIYQGDSFTLENNGVEISIVKVIDGNYGIRKVE